MFRWEKLGFEDTGQSGCVGSPGWDALDLEHKFGTNAMLP